ncbi:hypothetical protein HN419_03280 [Candidatus Woesearchaeota archaeon]|jgi:hypothetical protein|nr:hypothetical protein [Candidatus Woesearchaeota archaeon]MBT3536981.1 hypothetical protein [Candidatus Woesearchaeota archaeon]MBT4697591.1 hypothetical protein [Candidatus Woesearchaeota archaeon]MBT4717705.1 hypothetical protein [Candidatus Woesearchaeota archaeon]MBT7106709.1 hypothetical protein [Candidatus Woesearchaeota archaeon]
MRVIETWYIITTLILVAILIETALKFNNILDVIRIIIYLAVLILGYFVYDELRSRKGFENKQLKRAETVFHKHIVRKEKEISDLKQEKAFLLSTAIRSSEAKESSKKKETFKKSTKTNKAISKGR